MTVRLAGLLLAAVMMTGCVSYNVAGYQRSKTTTTAIEQTGIRPIAVQPFTAFDPGLANMTCRAAGRVNVSPDIATYIQNAFITELKAAGAYDPASPVRLSGRVDDISFSSGMSDGYWSMSLTLSNEARQSFTTKTRYVFEGSFMGEVACAQVRDYFALTVQRLLREVILNPRFKQIATPSQ